MKRILLFLVLCFITNLHFGQCDLDYDHNLIINEIGSFTTNSSNGKINDEYIELLVLGDPENPFAPVNVGGVIIDDNNAGQTGVGNEPGHVRFKYSFPEVDPGSLILIYNPQGVLVDPANDGLPNANGVYQLPIDHELLDLRESSPFNQEGLSDYGYGKSPHRGKTWDEFIPFRNLGDVAQIRNPAKEVLHAIGWTSHLSNTLPVPTSTIVFTSTRLSNKSIQFTGENPSIDEDFTISSDGSPGLPNNETNASLIENLTNGIIFNELQLKLSIVQEVSEGLSDGIIKVEIVGNNETFRDHLLYTINGTQHVIQGLSSPFLIENLSAGSYPIEVSELYGCYTFEGEITLISEKSTEEEICDGECITLNSDGVDPALIANSPCIKWIDGSGNVISSGTEVEVCPEGTEVITQYIENEDGLIQEVVYHTVTISDMSFTVDLKIPDECPPAQIEIAIEGENISEFLWFDGSTLNGLVVTSGGEYMVTLTSPDGCVSESSVVVSEDVFIDSDGDGICDEADCDPYEAFSGGAGTPCDDHNASTINDMFDENCECIGEIDPNDPCAGNDIDGDGICDDDEENNGTSPFDPCDPDDKDTDGDGICDIKDCEPDDFDIAYSIGDPCDDGNVSTIGDKINQNCQCEGFPDQNSPCPGTDIDGDGICDDIDTFPEDECNGIEVEITGDLSLCLNEYLTVLTVERIGGVQPIAIAWSTGEDTPTITADVAQLVDNKISVMVTDALGCTASAEIEIIEYQEPDSNGDGYCDDEECPKTNIGEYGTFPLMINNIEVIDVSGLNKGNTTNSRNGVCDLICETAQTTPPLNFNVCLIKLTSIKFSKSFCTQNDIGNVDAIEFILEDYAQYLNKCASVIPNEIFLIITDEEDYDKCCELKYDIEQGFWENELYQAGIWIDLKTDIEGNTVGEIKTRYYDIQIGCDYHWGGPLESDQLDIDPTGNFTKINNSLFGSYTSTVTPNPQNLINNAPYNGNGLSDFAGLSDDVRSNIETNVGLGKDTWSEPAWDYNTQFIISSANCSILLDGQLIPSSEAARSEYDANNSSSLVVWIHFDENNDAYFVAKINEDILENLKSEIESNLEFFANQHLSDITAKSINPTDLDPDLEGPNLWRFGLRENVDKQTNFWGISKEIGGLSLSAIRNVKTPEQIWKEAGNDNGQKSMFKIPPAVAGGSDALLENNPIGGVIQLVDLGEAIITEPQVRNGIIESVKHPLKTGKELMSQFSDDISGENGKEIQQFTIVKSSVGSIIAILLAGQKIIDFISTAGKKTSKKFKGFKEFLKDFEGPKADLFYDKIKEVLTSPNLQNQFRTNLLELGTPNCRSFIENPYLVDVWKKYVDEFPSKMDELLTPFKNGKLPFDSPSFYKSFKEAFVKVDGTIDLNVTKFFEDVNLPGNTDFVQLIKNKSNVVKAWKVFFPDQAVRTNATWLQKLDGYFTTKPNKLDEVTDQFAIEKSKNRVNAYLRGLLERKHYDGVVFRGDKASLTPTQAFNNGIPSKGGHDNLIKHLDGGNVNKGDFVSTSKDISIANDFAGNNGYVFKVKSRNKKGVDVNETLGGEVDNWFPEQLEVSMSGGIDKADIIGAYPKGQYSDADFIPNPNYVN